MNYITGSIEHFLGDKCDPGLNTAISGYVGFMPTSEETLAGDSPKSSSGRTDRSGSFRSEESQKEIDPSLLKKALDLVESIDLNDTFNTEIIIASLAGTVVEMWETAAESSVRHHDLLATLEAGVRQAKDRSNISREQLQFFRETLIDLGQRLLTRQHAESARHQFAQVGFGALPFATGSREEDDPVD